MNAVTRRGLKKAAIAASTYLVAGGAVWVGIQAGWMDRMVEFTSPLVTDKAAVVQEAPRPVTVARWQFEPVVIPEATGDDQSADLMSTVYADQLIDAGWYGTRGDGCECLYPPNSWAV